MPSVHAGDLWYTSGMNIKHLFAAALAAALATSLPAASEDYARHVNPSVGCAFNGHCFAAAAYPFGLVQAGPDTGNFSWNYTSGYRDADTTILGFSQTHLSGTGCPDLGDILVMPYAGARDRASYASAFEKATETATPGFYGVTLADNGVKVEVTVAPHAAIYRFTFLRAGAIVFSMYWMTKLVLLALVGALVLARRIVRPIEHMTKRINSLSGSDAAFEMENVYRTNDEIEILAESFADLSKKTRDYIQQITVITAEKERIGTELALATRIQADMLPNIFPPFPERSDFDIYATMDPAKEVGGDFYDFFLIDETHLGLVMADVSGKGVPAALFMMISKILVQNYAMTGLSPAEVLQAVNNQICANNREEMFVTVWLGILDTETGKVTAANAGHEYPVLMMQQSGQFELVKDKHGLVIGAMDGIRYKEYELALTKGTKLFLYTDGVPEATNARNELFGTDRMLAALNTEPTAVPEKILRNVREAVDRFVQEAEQFDDLTMLCLEFKGGKAV